MNLIDYLDPTIAVPFISGLDNDVSLYSKLIENQPRKQLPEIKTGDIVILGVQESRNSSNISAAEAPDKIRKYLYSLAPTSSSIRIIDLGNIKPTKSPVDTYAALKDLVTFLIDKQVRVIVLGGTQELTIPIFEALEKHKANNSISIIDSRIDLSKHDEFTSTSYINRLIDKPLSNLFNLSVIGYQGYLCDSKLLDNISTKNHETLRLGFVRGNMSEVEPSLRDSDLISFDLGAIKNSDCPGNFNPSPNGLYAEEACQLARLAGLNETNMIFGLFEYCPQKDVEEQSAHLAAQIVWHFLEASGQQKPRFESHPKKSLKKFIVNIGPQDNEMVFYKSLISDQWWIGIENNKPESNSNELVVACSYNDYLLASKQEIPERWFRLLRKTT